MGEWDVMDWGGASDRFVLARWQFTISFREEAKQGLRQLPATWLNSEDGDAFLSEHGGLWRRTIEQTLTPDLNRYFGQLGIPESQLPTVEYGDARRGSWILDAAMLVAATTASTWAIVKAVSELPEMADGLAELRQRIEGKLAHRINEEAIRPIDAALRTFSGVQELHPRPSQIPAMPLIVTVSLDVRPLLELTSRRSRLHRVHLGVAISREACVVENLADHSLEDISVGLFRDTALRTQWSFADAFTLQIPFLSGHQTINLALADFRDSTGAHFRVSQANRELIDCWVADSHGVFLFRLMLDELHRASKSGASGSPRAAPEISVREFSPITDFACRLFSVAKWISPMQWLAFRSSLFRSRSRLTLSEVASDEFTIRRARAIERYIVAWVIFELLLVVITCLTFKAVWIGPLLTVAVASRIIEIIQVTVNATLFDALSGRQDERVAAPTRTIVLGGVNFLELLLCFGVIYATNIQSLVHAGRPLTAFYFSTITQLTIGYGDVYPIGWLRVVAAIQGLIGILFVILVFGRFMASLPALRGILERKSGR